jgi:CTP synthase
LPNAPSIYQVPLSLEEQKIGEYITQRFGFGSKKADMSEWKKLNSSITQKTEKTVRVGIVAKYLDNEDTYFSIVESLRSAAWHHGVGLEYTWVDAEKIEENGTEELRNYDGILVPGGFGSRGVEGIIQSAKYSLENKVPYLGVCLGLQVAVIAAARCGGLADATSAELDAEAKVPVIYIMPDQKGKESTGGTMRLGNYDAVLREGSLAAKVYGTTSIVERHRHRYEVNREYETAFEKGGVVVSGESPNGRLVEFIEAPAHPYFIATQAHPEFRSRPNRPHPLFDGFIDALKKQ